MNSTLKIGVVFALLFCAVKYLIYIINPDAVSVTPSILTNIFLLMVAVFVGLFVDKRQREEDTNAMLDIKTGLRAGLPYAVIVALFLYAFYSWINPEYNQHQIAETSVVIDKMLNDPAELQKLKDQNPEMELKSVEEIRSDLMQGPQSIFTAGATSTLALLGMLVLGTLYSILVTAIFRTIFKPR